MLETSITCLSDKMIISVGSKQAQLISYMKSVNRWVKGKELMEVLYGSHYNAWYGSYLAGQLQVPIKCGLVERRVCKTLNRFGRVDVQWYEYRYTNPEGHRIRTDTIEWEDGKPDDWIRTVYIDGEIVFQGKDW